jgi:hypothetical protein
MSLSLQSPGPRVEAHPLEEAENLRAVAGRTVVAHGERSAQLRVAFVRSGRRLATRWLFPLLLWLATVSAVVARSGSLARWMTPRWDGVHYVSIADHGYTIARCGNPPIWCGNPWFPGWSYVNAAIAGVLRLRAFGASLDAVFVGTAAATLLILLVLLARHAPVFMRNPEEWSPHEGKLGLWACTGVVCQPGGFYHLTHYPYAFMLLTAFLFRILTIAPMRLGLSPRLGTWIAALSAFWCTLSYPTAFLFALYPFAGFVSDRRYGDARRWMKLVAWIGLFFSGTLCVCLIFYFKFGTFWLYFIHQAQYPHHAALVNTFSVLVDLLRAGNENERLTFLWYAFGITVICLRLRNAHREPSLWFVLLVLFFCPATGAWTSIYRYYLVALPMFVLLGATDCSRWLKLGYLVAGVLVQFGVLYPKYLDGALI